MIQMDMLFNYVIFEVIRVFHLFFLPTTPLIKALFLCQSIFRLNYSDLQIKCLHKCQI